MPATFSRLFERMDAQYPPATREMIRRSLIWLVYPPRNFTIAALAHAISIESDTLSLDQDAIPDADSISSWLGCLVHVGRQGKIVLSHFSIKEFLISDPDVIQNSSAQRYLIRKESSEYLIDTCMAYLALTDFDSAELDFRSKTNYDELDRLYPFYRHSAWYLQMYEETSKPHHGNQNAALETTLESQGFRRLFTNFSRPCLYLWTDYRTFQDSIELLSPEFKVSKTLKYPLTRATPTHLACGLNLYKIVNRLLADSPNFSQAQTRSPLHYLVKSTQPLTYRYEDITQSYAAHPRRLNYHSRHRAGVLLPQALPTHCSHSNAPFMHVWI